VTSRRKVAGIAALIGTGLAAGAIGAMVFGPGAAGAQTTTPAPKATSTAGTFHSNEDATHEKGESAQREADENAGRFGGGHFGRGGSNEDPAHEKGESAEREAQENANRAAAPSPSASG
jgi:hypothetical protein